MPLQTSLEAREALIYACRLVSLGFPVIWLRNPEQTSRMTPKGPQDLPPERRGKAPVAVGWRIEDALNDETLIRMWGNGEPGYNIGVRTGLVRGAATCIVVVDVDGEAALDWANDNLPETQVMVRTSGTYKQHWYYRCPQTHIGNRVRVKIGNVQVPLDIKADGGFVVGPGSYHGTGRQYQAVLPWNAERIASMPLFDPQWFGDGEWEGAENTRVAEGGSRTPPLYVDASFKRKRAIAYLNHAPGTVPQQGRGAGAECLLYARALVFGLCINPEEAANIMYAHDWNSRCATEVGDPYPWSIDELVHKCRDAYRLEFDKPYGYLLLEDRDKPKEPKKEAPPVSMPRAALEAAGRIAKITARMDKMPTDDDIIDSLAGHGLTTLDREMMRDRNSDTGDIMEALANNIDAEELASRLWDFPIEEKEIEDIKSREIPDTDTGNAERMILRFGDAIRFVEDRGIWLAWHEREGRWVPRHIAIERCSKIVARKIVEELPELEKRYAAAQQNVIAKKTMGEADRMEADHKSKVAELALQQKKKWQRASESSGHRDAMIRCAQSEASIGMNSEHFDRQHFMLNALNGVVDLSSDKREIVPHNRDHYFTKVCPINYDPDARSPTWDRCLQEWQNGDHEIINYLQRCAGYALTGDVREECMFIFVGEGRNGKSTFLNALRATLGPYSRTAPAGLLMETRIDKATPSQLAGLALLMGARFVVASETSETARMSEEQVKAITCKDPISAKWMHENPFEFEPTHHTFLMTNHKPTITGVDEGIWRRIGLVEWNYKVPKDQRDNGLADKLMAERPGILRWAVEGCAEWMRRGLDPPKQVIDAVLQYRKEQDTVGQFIEECIAFDDNAFLPKSNIRQRYEDWCDENSYTKMGGKKFNEILKERGIVEMRTSAFRAFAGVKFKN